MKRRRQSRDKYPIISARFVIAGVPPDKISKLVGMTPDEWGRAGEIRTRGDPPHEYLVPDDYWELHEAVRHGSEIEPSVENLLRRIEPAAAQLRRVPSTAMRKITVLASISSRLEPLSLYLNATLLAQLTKLKIDLDIGVA
jgi:hypothetical protein